MFTLLRRGPASISRSLLRSSLRLSHGSASSPLPLYHISQAPRLASSVKGFSTSSLCRRQALATKEQEEEFDDEDADAGGVTSRGATDKFVTRFDELAPAGLVCDTLVRTLTQDMNLETMTDVQSQTINRTLRGEDVLAQARTGTGKTLAFLIPVLQNIISKDPSLESKAARRSASAMDIRAIIISPTRELAEQIAVEAQKLVRNTGIIVQTAVGGSGKQYHITKMRNEGCHILVATPGRLNDVLTDQYARVAAPNLSAFVLDEADRLLDQGFAPDIQNIERLLPDKQKVPRQTLMFSATVPREVISMVRQFMKPGYAFIQTVRPGEQETHERIPQKMVHVKGMENLMPALLELCKRELARTDTERPFKAIVFFNANSEASMAAAIFQNLRNPGAERFDKHPFYPTAIVEMHSRLTQGTRTRNSERFRGAQRAIMFSSDVTARGMDFPDVTHVIQIGLPTTSDTYIHRIGRTGRGGKAGEGWLFLGPLERDEVRSRLRKIKIENDKSLETASVDMTRDAQLPEPVAATLTQAVDATKRVTMSLKSKAYKAAIGTYQWVHHKVTLIEQLNNRCKYGWGLEQPPNISPALVSRLGLRNIPGVNIGTMEEDDGDAAGASGVRRFTGRDGYRSGGFAKPGSDRGGRYGSDGGERSRAFGRTGPDRESSDGKDGRDRNRAFGRTGTDRGGGGGGGYGRDGGDRSRTFDKTDGGDRTRTFDRTDGGDRTRTFDRTDGGDRTRTFDRTDTGGRSRTFDRTGSDRGGKYGRSARPESGGRSFGSGDSASAFDRTRRTSPKSQPPWMGRGSQRGRASGRY